MPLPVPTPLVETATTSDLDPVATTAAATVATIAPVVTPWRMTTRNFRLSTVILHGRTLGR